MHGPATRKEQTVFGELCLIRECTPGPTAPGRRPRFSLFPSTASRPPVEPRSLPKPNPSILSVPDFRHHLFQEFFHGTYTFRNVIDARSSCTRAQRARREPREPTGISLIASIQLSRTARPASRRIRANDAMMMQISGDTRERERVRESCGPKAIGIGFVNASIRAFKIMRLDNSSRQVTPFKTPLLPLRTSRKRSPFGRSSSGCSWILRLASYHYFFFNFIRI